VVERGEIWWYEHPSRAPRPHLILTRSEAIPVLNQVLGVPTTRRARGIPSEVGLDEDDGMPVPCVLTLDGALQIRPALCTERITVLGPAKMAAVCEALRLATGC